MHLLAEITEKEVQYQSEPQEGRIAYNLRKAARAVLFDKEGKIAILHVRKHGTYKLPGGGIDEGESYDDGLAREIMEETGCTARVEKEVGMTIEYRDQWKLLQFSFCYTAHVLTHGEPNFTDEEIADGFELIWVDLGDAIELIENAKPTDYDAKFMRYRDLILLKKAKEILG
jgi:8-oxo-dGTP pyrophosphatase MutT (NUDIX family)